MIGTFGTALVFEVSDSRVLTFNEMTREVPSERIGEMVMDRLKDVDEVAYVRFASVYRQFKDIHTFMAELAKLLEEKP